MKRCIAVVTGSRAEYGLLYWLMREIQEDPDLELKIIVTGMHLSPEFGYTYKLIEADGFFIEDKIEILLSSDSAIGVAKAMGLATISFAESLARINPDILVILGDRFEILAVAQAAHVLKIPVAHIHGGEVTEGAVDDSLRHAITKLSHIHFAAAEPYRQRILQLGEDPALVFNLGAPGLDHIKRTQLSSRSELEQLLGIKLSKFNILVTYHPVTVKKTDLAQGLYEIFKALKQFPEAMVIFTKSNADEAGREIGRLIDDYVAEYSQQCHAFTTLGTPLYLSVVKQMQVVLGNSSSAIIEVPFLHVPSVNVGCRERGRLQANTVINCEEQADEIVAAIKESQSEVMQLRLVNMTSPYGCGDASWKIKNTLKEIQLENLIYKRFYDIWQTETLLS